MNRTARILLVAVPLIAATHIVAGREFAPGGLDSWSSAEIAVLKTLHIDTLAERPADPSNKYERSTTAAALGKRIFFDPRFSANQRVSCASCHDPEQQFQDGRALGQGIATGIRRTMPLVASGNSPWQFWDGRKDSVWSQALGPLEDAKEHGGNRVAYARLMYEQYRSDYEAVFHPFPDLKGLPEKASPAGTPAERAAWTKMTEAQRIAVSGVFANMGKAIAAYESTLSHGPARLDNYIRSVTRGSADATQLLTPSEKRGLRLFIDKAGCITCHAGPLFSDQHFHNTGVPPLNRSTPELGRAAVIATVLKDEFNCLGNFSDAPRQNCAELAFIAADDPHMVGAFKTPSLRNVALRAPYMHAGQIASLTQVVQHYAHAPLAAVGRSERNPQLMDEKEIADLVAFMGTLNSPIKENGQPLGAGQKESSLPGAASRR